VVVENLLRNVAKGEFPGDYLTVAVKNQGERRKAVSSYPERGSRRGVSQRRYQEVRQREDPFDPYKN